MAATFETRPGDPERIRAATRAQLEQRRATQPVDRLSCGSMFKNPPGDHAGRLIEAADLKGLRVGGAEVSEVHANFFVNRGEATADDVLELIGRVRERVLQHAGLCLETEVRVLGGCDVNQRKPNFRRRGRRTAGVLLLVGTLAAGAAYAARGLEFDAGPDYLRHARLSLTKVDFVGLRALNAKSLWALAEVPAQTSLIDLDLAAIEETLASHPRVESVQATRLPPARLVIGVRERQPVAFDAVTRLGIDARGERFPIAPQERAGLLPISGEIGQALPVIEALSDYGIEVTRIDSPADQGVRLEMSRAGARCLGRVREPGSAGGLAASARERPDRTPPAAGGRPALLGAGHPARGRERRELMARRDELTVGLDIGTTKICAVVTERRGDALRRDRARHAPPRAVCARAW